MYHGRDPRSIQPFALGIAEERDQARDALEEARRAWETWETAWSRLGRALQQADISTARIDAYRVGTGYDEGGGQSLEGWLDEIENQLVEGIDR